MLTNGTPTLLVLNQRRSLPPSLALSLKKDLISKTFYYAVAIGESTSSSRMHVSFESATRSGTSLGQASIRGSPSSRFEPIAFGGDWGVSALAPKMSAATSPRRENMSTMTGFAPRASMVSYLSPTALPPKENRPKMPIKPVVLHPQLQSYFWQIQQAVVRTVHPLIISNEASCITEMLISSPPPTSSSSSSPSQFAQLVSHDLFGKNDKAETLDQVLLSKVSNSIVLAALVDIRYVKTMSLVVHEILLDLMWKDVHLKSAFEATFVAQVMKTFETCWGVQANHYILATPTGLDPSPLDRSQPPLGLPNLSSLRIQVMNIAAFTGSLYAMGLLPHESFASCVTSLLTHITELIHLNNGPADSHPAVCVYLRALYLLLLSGTKGCVVPSTKYAPFLEQVVDELRTVAHGICEGKLAYKVMERRWLIEICNVLDSTISSASSPSSSYGSPWCTGHPAYYRWDPTLQGVPILGLADPKITN